MSRLSNLEVDWAERSSTSGSPRDPYVNHIRLLHLCSPAARDRFPKSWGFANMRRHRIHRCFGMQPLVEDAGQYLIQCTHQYHAWKYANLERLRLLLYFLSTSSNSKSTAPLDTSSVVFWVPPNWQHLQLNRSVPSRSREILPWKRYPNVFLVVSAHFLQSYQQRWRYWYSPAYVSSCVWTNPSFLFRPS